ncbi:unnamed protein product [Peronospora effusa]|nr:unnamed protein product [Peronospora effusa]
MYPIRNNNERIILTNRNRDTNLPINGSTLDNLLHDDEDDDEWDASDHFVLPRLVYHNAVVDDTSELTHQQEEIDLTVSSSEDEGGDTNAVGDSDDVIEIIEPLQTSDTIESTLFHRKRRRPRVVASENDVLGLKRQRSMDMKASLPRYVVTFFVLNVFA